MSNQTNAALASFARATGIEYALTLWPEWAWAIANLDKRVENRTWAPPISMVGKRIAIHSGASIGGRKGRVARREGLSAMMSMAARACWKISSELTHPPGMEMTSRQADKLYSDAIDGRPAPGVTGYITFRADAQSPTHPSPRAPGGAAVEVKLDPNAMPISAIVCTAILESVTKPIEPNEFDWWYICEYGFRLADVQVLPEPIRCDGLQKFWRIAP